MLVARSLFKMPRAALNVVSAASTGTLVLMAPSLHRLPCAAAATVSTHHVGFHQPARSLVLQSSHSRLSSRQSSVDQLTGRARTCAGAGPGLSGSSSTGYADTPGSSSSGSNSSSSSGQSIHTFSAASSSEKNRKRFSQYPQPLVFGSRIVRDSLFLGPDEFWMPLWNPTLNPSDEYERELLWMPAPEGNVDPAFVDACDAVGYANTGKWLLFYHKKLLDSAWQRAKQLLQSGELPGVLGIETTTAFRDPERHEKFNAKQGVLKFYCGSTDDEAGTTQLGEMIVSKMNYHGSGLEEYAAQAVGLYWKSHAQSLMGKYYSDGEGNVSSFKMCYSRWRPEKIFLQAGFDKATTAKVLRASIIGWSPRWEEASGSSSSTGMSRISASSNLGMRAESYTTAAATASAGLTSSAASQEPTAACGDNKTGSTSASTSSSQPDATAAAKAASAAKAATDAALAARAAANAAAATARAANAAAAAAEAAAKAAAAAEAAAVVPPAAAT